MREARKKAKEVLETSLHKSAPLSVKKRRIGVLNQSPARKASAPHPTAGAESVCGNASDVFSITSGNESELSNASLPALQTRAADVNPKTNWIIATRGKGRPQTTGEYKLKKRYVDLREKVATMEGVEGINDPNLAPKRIRTLEHLERELAPLMEEIHQAPMVDIISRALEKTDKIIKVADTSGNLKGCYMHILKRAAITILSAVTAVSTRSTAEGPWKSREDDLENLRLELRKARDENNRLEELVKKSHADRGSASRRDRDYTLPAPISSAGIRKDNRRRRGANVRKLQSTDPSSSEEEREVQQRSPILSPGSLRRISPKLKTRSPRQSSLQSLSPLRAADPFGITHPSERLGTPARDATTRSHNSETSMLEARLDNARHLNVDEQVLAADFDITQRINLLLEQRAGLREGFRDRILFPEDNEICLRFSSTIRSYHKNVQEDHPLLSSSPQRTTQAPIKPKKRKRKTKKIYGAGRGIKDAWW